MTATTVVALAAAVACLVRAGRRRGRMRVSWAALGLGALAGGLSAGPGAGYLIMILLGSAGMFLVPAPRRSLADRARGVLDTVLVALSLLILVYYLVIETGAHGLSYPVADVVLGTNALIGMSWLRRGAPDLVPLTVSGAGLLVIAFADSLGHAGAHAAGAVGWFAGFAVLLAGAVLPGAAAPAEPDRDGLRAITLLLPYVVVTVALVTGLIRLSLGGHPTTLGAWTRSLWILLIVVRQALLVAETRGLTRRLESRVGERATELHERELRFRALVEQSTDSATIVGRDTTIRYQSESVERIFGWPAAELRGRRLAEIVGSAAGPAVLAAVEEVAGTPGATTVIEIMVRHADGGHRLAEMTVTNLLDDPYVNGLVCNTRDISEAYELQERLRYEAYHDALTGLPNRAGFRERLAGATGRGEVAILFLDLDGFKAVNDSLGHDAGDHLLVRVADRLRRCVPEPATVARIGGDEFAVIVEAADAERTATAILAALADPIQVDGRELHVGAAVGVAAAADAGDVEQLMRNADLAMYKAKDAGGGGYATYDSGMHDALVRRVELAADLRLALERHELVLHYQPTVDLPTGAIIGFEALVRWQHPTRGMVPPLDFIGVAESTGLIVPLGRWVLTEACRQAVAWGAGPGRPLKMAVNVSVRQFEAGDLAGTVAEVLAATGMPPDQLVLEMTESVLLTDTDENLSRIVELKALGVMLAMDDFGTGYSSLAYLRRFPMDVLKIDRSFVDRLGGDTEDEALVRTIVRLGQRFGMRTVAEGIEEAVQATILRDMGCDYGQGYFLSRPLPAAEATVILSAGVPAMNLAS